MSIITFLNNDKVTLASSKIVYSEDDVGNIESLVSKATELTQLLDKESVRVEQAELSGYDAGYEKGQTKGYDAALEHIAIKLITLAREAEDTRDKLEQSAGDLALKIVRRIANDLGTEQTLASLAATAAKELVPREAVTLRVSVSNLEKVREAILSTPTRSHRIPDITGDPTLLDDECVLDTEFGQIKADLETQLRVYKEHFYAYRQR